MSVNGAETKDLVLEIFELCPDEPRDAIAVLALAFAFGVVGAGWSREVADAAMNVAFRQALKAKAEDRS